MSRVNIQIKISAFRYYLSKMSSEDDMQSYYGGDSHEDDRSSEESEEEDDEDHKATEKLARVPGLTFCPDHKPGQMIEVCLTCRTALALVRPNVAKQLMIPDKTSSAVHRYATVPNVTSYPA